MKNDDLRKYMKLFESPQRFAPPTGTPKDWYLENPGVGKYQGDEFHSEKYFNNLAGELSKQFNYPFKLDQYHYGNSTEVVSYLVDIPGIEPVTFVLVLSWKKDGSPGKPMTYIIVGDDGEEIQFGRMARWDDPASYAEDLGKSQDLTYALHDLEDAE